MKILSFDVESNGLHGTPFAVGAIVLEFGSDGSVGEESFTGRASLDFPTDWIAENVLPHIQDLPLYRGTKALRDAFWVWYEPHREGALVFADFGWPVEARFFSDCIGDDPDNRAWKGPYPMHDLGTLLYAAGVDPDINRRQWCRDTPGAPVAPFTQHNPFDDAVASAWCIVRAMRKLGIFMDEF